jgi:hypothetical protein
MNLEEAIETLGAFIDAYANGEESKAAGMVFDELERLRQVESQARNAVAAELRRLAAEMQAEQDAMRDEDDRTIRSIGFGRARQVMRERADELDPAASEVASRE